MKNGGVFQAEDLTVTVIEGKSADIVTVKLTKSDDKEPEFASVTLKTENVKQVRVSPVDKNGKPTAEALTVTVTDPSKPVDVKFASVVKADKLVIIVTKDDADKPSKTEIVSVKACTESKGDYTFK